ncbi:MAG: hypothetical protein JSS55_13170 [Proteobacteria bacterium]|nr:hypothetical protein [Pseudomonadota bacterium]
MKLTLNMAGGRGFALAGAASLLALSACQLGKTAAPPDWPQGWSPDDQARWYAATQGSRLMPLAWFRALERPTSTEPFGDMANMSRYRLLPGVQNNLPLGFAIDDNDDSDLTVSKLRWFAGQGPKEQWVGLNCSACHTAELNYRGQAMRIDGGPSLFDFQTFIVDLDAALKATRDDAGKFDRFAKAVLKDDNEANRTLLRDALGKLIAWEEKVERLNGQQQPYGYGRVDAFGHIFNKVALFNGAPNPSVNAADAPVSYPFLWDIYRHDRLQWNGIVTNARLPLGGSRYLDYGAMGRNTGEVIGVFGDVATKPGNGLGGYKSSVWADNLIRLETQLAHLKAPRWPAAFGALDDTEAKKQQLDEGKTLFGQKCASCHAPQPGSEPYKVTMVTLKPDDRNATDPWMACNAITYRSATGNMQGIPKGYIGNGEKMGAVEPLAEQLETLVKGAMIGKKGQIIAQTARVFFGAGGRPRVVIEEVPNPRPLILQACYAANSPFMAYKARPLDGIWATAPYLHNGSVPNLYELLLPPAQRSKTFRMGTRDYDPVLAGYSTQANAPGNSFTFDTAVTGNSNMGHDYGVGTLTPEQRTALLNYLKTL